MNLKRGCLCRDNSAVNVYKDVSSWKLTFDRSSPGSVCLLLIKLRRLFSKWKTKLLRCSGIPITYCVLTCQVYAPHLKAELQEIQEALTDCWHFSRLFVILQMQIRCWCLAERRNDVEHASHSDAYQIIWPLTYYVPITSTFLLWSWDGATGNIWQNLGWHVSQVFIRMYFWGRVGVFRRQTVSWSKSLKNINAKLQNGAAAPPWKLYTATQWQNITLLFAIVPVNNVHFKFFF